MTEQKEHYDKYIARYRALLERYGYSPADLNEDLEKHKTFYLVCRIIYAIEDSLSFLLGNVKLYFSLLASYFQRSDAGAADDLHYALQSIPDLLIIIGLGVPLVIIQVLGAYFSDSPDLNSNKFKYFFAKILAPYLRDVLQGIKWAYKGMRSVLNMAFYFMLSHKELVVKILFPLTIAVAVVSLLNRIFLRTLRNFRKKRQSENRKISIETLEDGYGLKFRKEMPTEDKAFAKLKRSLLYIPDDPNNSFKLYFVDDNCKIENEEIALDEELKKQIYDKIQQYQSDNIRRRLELEFVNENIEKLIFLENIPENFEQYKNTIIFLIDDKLDNTKKLIRVDAQGIVQYDSNSTYFTQALNNEIKNKNALNLYEYQIEELIEMINYQKDLGLTMDEWKLIKEQKKPKVLSNGVCSFSYASVILSALIDGSYFYIGVLFMASFNPAGFIAMLAMASIMLMVCLISRVYEEYFYQKSFLISQIEIGLNIQKTEVNILKREILKKINEQQDLEKCKALLVQYRQALLNYAEQQEKLEAQIRISGFEAFLKGLKNGLSTQGVVSALMFLGVTIMFLTGTACPPAFIFSMMAISFVILIRSVYRYMQSYQEYKKTYVALEKVTIDEISEEQIGKLDNLENANNIFTDLQYRKNQIEERILSKPPDLKEEENSEVVRIACTGFTKFQKNFGECTLGEPRNGSEWWETLTSVCLGAIMVVVFGARGNHKMYSSPDDNPNVMSNKGLVPSQSGDYGFFNKAKKSKSFDPNDNQENVNNLQTN